MTRRLISPRAKKLTSVLVLLVFVATLLPACGGGGKDPTTTSPAPATTQPTTTAPKTTLPATTTTTTKPYTTTPIPTTTSNIVSGKLNEENLKVSGKGVSIEVSPVCLNEEAQVTIAPMENMLINDELSVNAWDFRIDTDEELVGLMDITIPYDKTLLPAGADPAEYVGACYYNQALKVWEPVSYDINPSAGNITITTDHLSVYGAFVVDREYTRAAYVDFTLPKVAIRNASSSADYAGIISEAIDNGMNPGPSALELGNKVVGDWLNMSGAGITFLTNTVYASEFLDGIGNAMGNVGLLSAIAQAAVDYQNGDSKALHTNLIKNLTYYGVSKFGSAILQLGSVGVYCIDYALSEFATEAWSGRENIYTEAYRLYYLHESGVKRTPKDWYLILEPMAKQAKSSQELNQKIMAEIDRYCWQFWEDETIVAAYQSQAQKNGFTGGGGLNQGIMDKISGRQKNDLLNDSLDAVFIRLGRVLAQEHENQVGKELDAIAQELNRIVTVQIYDSVYDEADPKPEKALYAGYIARIAPLADEVIDKEWWQKEISDEGKASLPFRVLGHIMAGSPNKVEIVNPEDDEVVKEVEFIVMPPTVSIDIGEELELNSFVYSSGTSTATPGEGIRAALANTGTIRISKDGKFSAEVPSASTTTKTNEINWTINASNFTMEGTWDNTAQSGTVNISCTVDAYGVERAPFADDPGMEKHYAKSEFDYLYSMTGSGTITMEDNQLVMTVKYSYSRSGISTLGIYNFYNDRWHAPDNPTITDKSGNFKATWTYRFNFV
jgi:hypothetical protein